MPPGAVPGRLYWVLVYGGGYEGTNTTNHKEVEEYFMAFL